MSEGVKKDVMKFVVGILIGCAPSLAFTVFNTRVNAMRITKLEDEVVRSKELNLILSSLSRNEDLMNKKFESTDAKIDKVIWYLVNEKGDGSIAP